LRYYNILITDPNTGKTKLGPFSSNLPNGQFDPGALNVELDIPVAPFGTPDGTDGSGVMIRIWGIPLFFLSQATNLNDFRCQVYGGMGKGLPLANPSQQGLLVDGIIFQAYGNWVNTDMTLDINMIAAVGSINAPMSHILQWNAGVQLSTAITQTLNATYPGYKVNINISNDLVLPYDESGFYPSLNEFTRAVSQLATSIATAGGSSGTYSGILVTLKGKTFTVTDSTYKPKPKQLVFTDLVGQPTWISQNEIQFYTVLRGDIQIGDLVSMPVSQNGIGVLSYTSAQSLSALKNQSIFQGTFLVTKIRHIGNFRSPDSSQNWITTVNAVTT